MRSGLGLEVSRVDEVNTGSWGRIWNNEASFRRRLMLRKGVVDGCRGGGFNYQFEARKPFWPWIKTNVSN